MHIKPLFAYVWVRMYYIGTNGSGTVGKLIIFFYTSSSKYINSLSKLAYLH